MYVVKATLDEQGIPALLQGLEAFSAFELVLTGKTPGSAPTLLFKVLLTAEKPESPAAQDVTVEKLGLSNRAANALIRAKVLTVHDILERFEFDGVWGVYSITTFGRKSLQELLNTLQTRGYLTEERTQQLRDEAGL
jgi:DNA-directed RNA polymerase alpha subunit